MKMDDAKDKQTGQLSHEGKTKLKEVFQQILSTEI